MHGNRNRWKKESIRCLCGIRSFSKNSASFMDQFENYIHDTQENRKLSTGFKRLDAMLRYGLHKGTYFIDSEPQYLKKQFYAADGGPGGRKAVWMCFTFPTELSRYDLMVEDNIQTEL